MNEILTLFIVAIALSMDTFSLSLGLGTNLLSKKNIFLFSFIVGTFHFMMPIAGNILGNSIISFLSLNSNIILGLILIYLAISMFIERSKEEKKYILSLKIMFVLAISVSLDSFSMGIGIKALTNNIFMAVSIFSVTSFVFTYIGLIIGKYTSKLLGKYSTLIGSIILFCLGILEICK